MLARLAKARREEQRWLAEFVCAEKSEKKGGQPLNSAAQCRRWAIQMAVRAAKLQHRLSA